MIDGACDAQTRVKSHQSRSAERERARDGDAHLPGRATNSDAFAGGGAFCRVVPLPVGQIYIYARKKNIHAAFGTRY